MLSNTDTVGDLLVELTNRVDAALAAKKKADAELATVVAEMKRLTNTDGVLNARSYMSKYMDALNNPVLFSGVSVEQIVKDVFTGFTPQLSRGTIQELDAKHSKAEQNVNKAEAKYKRVKDIYNYTMEMIQT